MISGLISIELSWHFPRRWMTLVKRPCIFTSLCMLFIISSLLTHLSSEYHSICNLGYSLFACSYYEIKITVKKYK